MLLCTTQDSARFIIILKRCYHDIRNMFTSRTMLLFKFQNCYRPSMEHWDLMNRSHGSWKHNFYQFLTPEWLDVTWCDLMWFDVICAVLMWGRWHCLGVVLLWTLRACQLGSARPLEGAANHLSLARPVVEARPQATGHDSPWCQALPGQVLKKWKIMEDTERAVNTLSCGMMGARCQQ